jgi:uncharacterized tellurite resistance protein B-like protein
MVVSPDLTQRTPASEMAAAEGPGALARIANLLRSWLAPLPPDVPFDHAVAALLAHAASVRGPMSPPRRRRAETLLRDYLRRDEPSVEALLQSAQREDDQAVDVHHFARVVNRALSQEERLAVFAMAALVAFADDAGAEEEGFLRLLGGLLGISDHDRGIVQHRARVTGDKSSPTP